MVTTDVSKRHSDRIWAENVVAKGAGDLRGKNPSFAD